MRTLYDGTFLAQSPPIHIDGTDVMEMPVNDDDNNNGKDEGGYRRE